MLRRIFSYMKEYKKYAWLALICIGVVTTTKTDRYTYEELIKVADDAMYESKNKGKNQYNIIRL